MKKIIIALSVFVAMATGVQGQIIYSLKGDKPAEAPVAEKKDGLGFGPELGLNLANMAIKSGGSTTKTSFLPGLAAGIIVDYAFTKNLYLQPGLFYVMNGCNVSSTTVAGTTTPSYSITLNTIQLPINVEYKLGKPHGNRLFFGLGPYIAYNISGSSTGANSTVNIGSDKTNDNIKALDFGAGVNLGYQIAMGLFARVHYQMGFLSLAETSANSTSTTTSAISISIGYLFGEKPKTPKTPKAPEVNKPEVNMPQLGK